jgi:fumarate reductase subunit C
MHWIASTHFYLFLQAMIARGFRGDPSNHKIYFLRESSFGFADLFSLLCLFALMGLASYSDQLV